MTGKTLGKYRVLDEIGDGAWGTGYSGEPALRGGKAVAIGVLPADAGVSDELMQKFFDSDNQSGSPAFADVHDFGVDEESGAAFLVVKRFDPADPEAVLDRLAEVAEALAAARDEREQPPEEDLARAPTAAHVVPDEADEADEAAKAVDDERDEADAPPRKPRTRSGSGGGSTLHLPGKDPAVTSARRKKPRARGAKVDQPGRETRTGTGKARPATGLSTMKIGAIAGVAIGVVIGIVVVAKPRSSAVVVVAPGAAPAAEESEANVAPAAHAPPAPTVKPAPPPAPAPPAAAPPAAAPPAAAATPAPSAAAPPAAPEPAAPPPSAAAAAAVPAADPAAQDMVTIRFGNRRPGTKMSVRLDGRSASLPLRLPRGSTMHSLRVHVDGFADQVFPISASRSQTLEFGYQPDPNGASTLPPSRRPGRPPPASKGTPSF